MEKQENKTFEEKLHKEILHFLKNKGYLNQAQQEHMFVVVSLIEEFSLSDKEKIKELEEEVVRLNREKGYLEDINERLTRDLNYFRLPKSNTKE